MSINIAMENTANNDHFFLCDNFTSHPSCGGVVDSSLVDGVVGVDLASLLRDAWRSTAVRVGEGNVDVVGWF